MPNNANNNAKLNNPWMVAVWPGMGQVAISAGYYLIAKLQTHLLAEFSPEGLFDIEYINVKDGLIQTGRLPRSRLFVWKDAAERHDLVIFVGEAQPPIGKWAFCHKLVRYAQELGVERIFTFAAMATDMRPERDSRVFAASTDIETLEQLRSMDLEIVEDGQIGGLNGVLLGIAAEQDVHGACLLGEMPQVFTQLPYPKASLAVLEVFTEMAGIDIDLSELAAQAREVNERLGELLHKVEQHIEQQMEPEDEFELQAVDEDQLSREDEEHIERLFEQAKQDRTKAYELKRELDRLEVFDDYEDRFLDLFKRPDS